MTEDEPWQDPESPRDARLASLDERLAKARVVEAIRTGQKTRDVAPKGGDQGMRVLSVLVGYPLGSVLIGWVIDRLAGTHWIWVVMLFLGFGTAIREIWKISQQPPPGGRDR